MNLAITNTNQTAHGQKLKGERENPSVGRTDIGLLSQVATSSEPKTDQTQQFSGKLISPSLDVGCSNRGRG
jgi:hypothetical protein